jgi:hypothetical protein
MESRRNVRTIDVDANAEAHVTIQTAAEARTPLGRRLCELRVEIARSGAAPLGWDEIESEVAVRRGARTTSTITLSQIPGRTKEASR